MTLIQYNDKAYRDERALKGLVFHFHFIIFYKSLGVIKIARDKGQEGIVKAKPNWTLRLTSEDSVVGAKQRFQKV